MKQLIVAFFATLAFSASAQITTANKAVRDSLYESEQFRSLVYDITYNIALDVIADTTEYSIAVRPFFDRFITTPDESSNFMTNMIARACLLNGQTVITIGGAQSLQTQLLYIIKTLGIWQGPVNAYIRRRTGDNLFPRTGSGSILQTP